jgi:hypothetical protein
MGAGFAGAITSRLVCFITRKVAINATGESSHPREYRVSFVGEVGLLIGTIMDRNEL